MMKTFRRALFWFVIAVLAISIWLAFESSAPEIVSTAGCLGGLFGLLIWTLVYLSVEPALARVAVLVEFALLFIWVMSGGWA